MDNSSGFTLLELLVALTIFSLIGLGGHNLIRSILKDREVAQEHSQKLTEIQKAVWIMTEDFIQMEPGSQSADNPNYSIRFIRRGWRNPFSLPRGDRLAVAYGISGNDLLRYYWQAGEETGPPHVQTLMKGVSTITFAVKPPRIVELLLTTQTFGKIQRILEVPEP